MAPLDSLRAALADRYRLDRQLGQGGMATVYLAHDLKHDRDVALKVLRPELAAVLGRDRFLTEIRLTAKLDHPHLLTLIDSGESDSSLWYVLPLVRGESLRERLNREQQLGVEEAFAITQQIAGALHYAHQHGVIHRDIKPENILLHEGEAMLADFGIALAVKEAAGNRLTETGISLGTPQYMSPEQTTGEQQLDARSDVYSLAAVLYEMLAGEPPLSGPTAQAIIAKLMTERPTRLRVIRDAVPVEIDAAVAKALAKVPADRFPTMAAFAGALRSPTQTARTFWPSPVVWGRAITLVATLLVIAAIGLWLANRRDPGVRLPAPPRQVTFTGTAEDPALSPKGDLLAYTADDHLFIQDLAGGSAIEVLTDSLKAVGTPTWSLDGTQLRFLGRLPGERLPSWYVVPRLGGRVHRLTDNPDGGNLIWWQVSLAHGLYADSLIHIGVVPWPDTLPGETLTLPPGFWQVLFPFAMSPNGRWVAVSGARHDSTGVVLLSRDGEKKLVLVMEPGFFGLYPRWGAGGDRVDYLGQRGLMTLRIDPVSAHILNGPELLLPETGIRDFSISADRSRLAYERFRMRSQIWALRLGDETSDAPVAALQLTKGTATSYSPAIAPSGQRVAFVRSVNRTDDLYMVPTSGGEPGRLTFLGAELPYQPFSQVAWSPDEHKLAFLSFAADRRPVPTVLDLLSGETRQIAPRIAAAYGLGTSFLAWAHNDTTLVYVGQRPTNETLVSLDLTTGKEVDLLPESGSFSFPLGVAVSPDGKRVAFQWRDAGDQQIRILSLDDRSLRQLPATINGIPLIWARNGQLYFERRESETGVPIEVWRVSVDGGRPRLYVRLPSGCRGPSISADATLAVCQQTEGQESDIWVVDNFEGRTHTSGVGP